MQIEYRIAGMEDLEKIFTLVTGAIHTMDEQGIFQWDELYPDKTILREDIAKEQLRVGAVEGQIAVIYVLNQECDEAYQTGRWMHQKEPFYVIHRLCVNPAFQNKGVAGSTMLHIEQELLAMGITAIRLDVFSQNPYALKLYDSLGCTRVGEAHWRMGEFFLMEKCLGKGENWNMLPTREEAEAILKEAEKCNPGS